MRKSGIIVAVVVALFFTMCVGGFILASQYVRHRKPSTSDGPWTIQMAAAGCSLAYRKKDPTADAQREAQKPHPKFRSVFTAGEWAGDDAEGFPLRCSGVVLASKWFEGVDEYVEEPRDGDSPSTLQNMCTRAKYQYAASFNLRLGQSRPALYRAACDANERAREPGGRTADIAP
jgi:hypothetical protein